MIKLPFSTTAAQQSSYMPESLLFPGPDFLSKCWKTFSSWASAPASEPPPQTKPEQYTRTLVEIKQNVLMLQKR